MSSKPFSSDNDSGCGTGNSRSETLAHYSAKPYIIVPSREDSGFWVGIHSYAIEPHHPIVAQWDSYLQELVMGEVRKLPIWIAVDVLRRGCSEKRFDCVPSIIITITPNSLSGRIRDFVDWLWRSCNAHRSEVNVEAIEGRLRGAHHASNQPNITDISPTIGKSIGLHGQYETSGTAGGYVKIQKLGHPAKICALTCQHIVAPDNQCKLTFFVRLVM